MEQKEKKKFEEMKEKICGEVPERVYHNMKKIQENRHGKL